MFDNNNNNNNTEAGIEATAWARTSTLRLRLRLIFLSHTEPKNVVQLWCAVNWATNQLGNKIWLTGRQIIKLENSIMQPWSLLCPSCTHKILRQSLNVCRQKHALHTTAVSSWQTYSLTSSPGQLGLTARCGRQLCGQCTSDLCEQIMT